MKVHVFNVSSLFFCEYIFESNFRQHLLLAKSPYLKWKGLAINMIQNKNGFFNHPRHSLNLCCVWGISRWLRIEQEIRSLPAENSFLRVVLRLGSPIISASQRCFVWRRATERYNMETEILRSDNTDLKLIYKPKVAQKLTWRELPCLVGKMGLSARGKWKFKLSFLKDSTEFSRKQRLFQRKFSQDKYFSFLVHFLRCIFSWGPPTSIVLSPHS